MIPTFLVISITESPPFKLKKAHHNASLYKDTLTENGVVSDIGQQDGGSKVTLHPPKKIQSQKVSFYSV